MGRRALRLSNGTFGGGEGESITLATLQQFPKVCFRDVNKYWINLKFHD